MAAKLLHSLTDENPDLQKQIGCMTGIFQLFDQHHIISSRCIAGHSHKRLLPGNSHFNNGSLEAESNIVYHRQTPGLLRERCWVLDVVLVILACRRLEDGYGKCKHYN